MINPKMLLAILPLFWPKMPPIGLAYLQEFLLKSGFYTDVIDFNIAFYNLSDARLKKEWLISCNASLERNILSILRKNYPQEYNDAVNTMLAYDVIGFSCYKSNFESTYELMSILKSKREDIKIILGGPEITRKFFTGSGKIENRITKFADFLVVGEGERALLSYLRGSDREAIARFNQLKNLQDLAFPRYQGLDLKIYPKDDAMPIQFSRGCIRKCNFCSERMLYRGFRARPVESVIEEIRHHREQNNINYFIFFDSLINADLARLEDLCDKIMANFGRVNWEAQIAVRDDMTDKLLEKMQKSGCYNLFVGLESGSDKTLKKMNKGFTVKEAVNFFQKLNRTRLFFGVSIIVGYPGESDADFQESLDFIVQNKSLIPKIEQVNPFTYYDGTPADKRGDYRINRKSLKRMDTFINEIKRYNFKYTNAFLGNLIEKYD